MHLIATNWYRLKLRKSNCLFGLKVFRLESLINWDGSENFPGYKKLIADLASILGEPPIEVKEAERAAEAERQRKQEEGRRKAEERRRIEEKQKRAEAERKVEEERKRKAEEERKRKESEEKARAMKEPVERKIEPPTPQQNITNSIGMEFVLIPAGSFTMGSSTGDR